MQTSVVFLLCSVGDSEGYLRCSAPLMGGFILCSPLNADSGLTQSKLKPVLEPFGEQARILRLTEHGLLKRFLQMAS